MGGGWAVGAGLAGGRATVDGGRRVVGWIEGERHTRQQHSTVQYSTVQHGTVQHGTAQHSTAQRAEAGEACPPLLAWLAGLPDLSNTRASSEGRPRFSGCHLPCSAVSDQ